MTVAERRPRMVFFTFPENARWNPERSAAEFGVSVGEYDGIVRVPRRIFQPILTESPTPERCIEAYYLNRTRLERIAERKLRRRQLTDYANVEITGRDLRERDTTTTAPRIAFRSRRAQANPWPQVQG